MTVHEINWRTHFDRKGFFGTAPTSWVNKAADGPVLYLYDGNPFWNAVWEYAFWNDRIRWVGKLPSPSPGPMPNALAASAQDDGRLVDDRGQPLPGREVVASSVFTFRGKIVAEAHQTGLDQAGLRLWQLSGPPRLSTSTTGLRTNGDIQEPVHMTVYACGPGRLELTLTGKQGTPVQIDIDGRPIRRVTPTAGMTWTGSVPAPRSANGKTRCVYGLSSPGLVGSTRLEFVRE